MNLSNFGQIFNFSIMSHLVINYFPQRTVHEHCSYIKDKLMNDKKNITKYLQHLSKSRQIQIQFNASVSSKINDGVHELHKWHSNKRNIRIYTQGIRIHLHLLERNFELDI